jgi:hypothetical protein
LGLCVVLYRTHALLAGARALHVEGQYLGVERAVAGRLSAVMGRDRHDTVAPPATPATAMVGSTADKRTEATPAPTHVEPVPPPAAPEPKPSSMAEQAAAPSNETTEAPTKSKRSGSRAVARSAKAAAGAKKSAAAPEASDEEEAPKSRASQTVSLDEDSQEEAPKSLWPSKQKKAAAAKSESSKSTAKESAEPPSVNSTLSDAMRAASGK